MRERHTIQEWEHAIADRNDIRFEKMELRNGFVLDVAGYLSVDGREHIAYWLENGKCFSPFEGCASFDIKFSIYDQRTCQGKDS